MAYVTGGDKIGPRLADIAVKFGQPSVKVGFLSGSTYPDGTPTPLVATMMEFGVNITTKARDQTIFRNVDLNTGEFRGGGRFVRQNKANLATTHAVASHQITILPRPYFRGMIARNRGGWGAKIVELLRQTSLDGHRALELMGLELRAQLQESILALMSPPLAKSTIRRKGFSKPLVETSHLLNSVDSEVTDGR